jgi:hypothetical protein
MTEDDKAPRNVEAFTVVGELVMISSAIDHLLNNVLIEVLDLGGASLLEPVVATLDPPRKVEILKERPPISLPRIGKRELRNSATRWKVFSGSGISLATHRRCSKTAFGRSSLSLLRSF